MAQKLARVDRQKAWLASYSEAMRPAADFFDRAYGCPTSFEKTCGKQQLAANKIGRSRARLADSTSRPVVGESRGSKHESRQRHGRQPCGLKKAQHPLSLLCSNAAKKIQ